MDKRLSKDVKGATRRNQSQFLTVILEWDALRKKSRKADVLIEEFDPGSD
jgi:hypothetical protein